MPSLYTKSHTYISGQLNVPQPILSHHSVLAGFICSEFETQFNWKHANTFNTQQSSLLLHIENTNTAFHIQRSHSQTHSYYIYIKRNGNKIVSTIRPTTDTKHILTHSKPARTTTPRSRFIDLYMKMPCAVCLCFCDETLPARGELMWTY